MHDHDLHQMRVKRLLAQDPEINETQMEEFRMELQESLEAWEERSRRTRRRILIALGVYLAGMVICWFLALRWREAAPDATAALWRGLLYWPPLASALVAALAGFWMIALYAFKYAPQLNRTRFEMQLSVMLELQRQVKRLCEHFEQREK